MLKNFQKKNGWKWIKEERFRYVCIKKLFYKSHKRIANIISPLSKVDVLCINPRWNFKLYFGEFLCVSHVVCFVETTIWNCKLTQLKCFKCFSIKALELIDTCFRIKRFVLFTHYSRRYRPTPTMIQSNDYNIEISHLRTKQFISILPFQTSATEFNLIQSPFSPAHSAIR